MSVRVCSARHRRPSAEHAAAILPNKIYYAPARLSLGNGTWESGPSDVLTSRGKLDRHIACSRIGPTPRTTSRTYCSATRAAVNVQTVNALALRNSCVERHEQFSRKNPIDCGHATRSTTTKRVVSNALGYGSSIPVVAYAEVNPGQHCHRVVLYANSFRKHQHTIRRCEYCS